MKFHLQFHELNPINLLCVIKPLSSSSRKNTTFPLRYACENKYFKHKRAIKFYASHLNLIPIIFTNVLGRIYSYFKEKITEH